MPEEIKEQWEIELENALEALHFEQSYSGNWHPEWIKELFLKTVRQQRQQAKQEVLEELEKIEHWQCTDMGFDNDSYMIIRRDSIDRIINQLKGE